MHFFRKKKSVQVEPWNEQPEGEGESIAAPKGDASVDIPEQDAMIVPRANPCRKCCTKEVLKEQALLLATIVSVALGVIVGVALRTTKCPGGTNERDGR
jgi:hypothetical protein